MPRYRYERGHVEYWSDQHQQFMERPTKSYRIIDNVFGQIANCHSSADAERIVNALNAAESKK